MNNISLLEAAVWEDFYALRDIESSMQSLRAADAQAAEAINKEIKEILYSYDD